LNVEFDLLIESMNGMQRAHKILLCLTVQSFTEQVAKAMHKGHKHA
jgi:hypothetical protein